MHDYLIVKGQIDPIEEMKAGQNRPRHDSDALVGVGVLHNAIMHDNFRTLVGVSDLAPLQLADENKVGVGSGTPQ